MNNISKWSLEDLVIDGNITLKRIAVKNNLKVLTKANMLKVCGLRDKCLRLRNSGLNKF
jgi:hypothetical protein